MVVNNAGNLLKVNKSSLRLKQKNKKSGLKSPPINELNEDDSNIQVGVADYEADGFEDIDLQKLTRRLEDSELQKLNVDSSNENLQKPQEVTVKGKSRRLVEDDEILPHEINYGN